ncbi:MAG: DMT family transporter [Polyangiaceae bacterium]
MPSGELSTIVAALTWAIASMMFRRLSARVSAFAMNVAKCAFAGTMLLVTRVLIGGEGPLSAVDPKAWAALASSSIVGLAIGDSAYFAAMASLGVPRAILLLSSAPIFTALGGVFLLNEPLGLRASPRDHHHARKGIALVVTRSTPSDEPSTRQPRASVAKGIAFGLVAALAQAGGSLLSKGAMQAGIDPLAASVGRLFVAVVGLLGFGIVTGRLAIWARELSTDRVMLKISGASMLGTYLGIWLSQYAIQHARSTGVASTLLATSPLFALPLAHITGVERATVRSVMGAIIALGGVTLLTVRF